MNEILNLPLKEIRPPSIIMSLVNKDSLSYLELRESIRSDGMMQNLTVKQSENTNYKYELVTGLKRYTIAQELELEYVPCLIIKAESSDIIIKQIQENCCRDQPSKLDLYLHFKRLLLCRPDLTFGDIAMLVHKSPMWVKDILSLQELIPEAKVLMEDNEITITAAVVLAKLPTSIQYDLLDSSIELDSNDFLQKCRKLKKAYTAAAKQGNVIEWEKQYLTDPVPSIRTFSEVRQEYILCEFGKQFMKDNPTLTPLEIWKKAMEWVIQLDPVSVKKHYEKLQEVEERRHKYLNHAQSPRTIKKKSKD